MIETERDLIVPIQLLFKQCAKHKFFFLTFFSLPILSYIIYAYVIHTPTNRLSLQFITNSPISSVSVIEMERFLNKRYTNNFSNWSTSTTPTYFPDITNREYRIISFQRKAKGGEEFNEDQIENIRSQLLFFYFKYRSFAFLENIKKIDIPSQENQSEQVLIQKKNDLYSGYETIKAIHDKIDLEKSSVTNAIQEAKKIQINKNKELLAYLEMARTADESIATPTVSIKKVNSLPKLKYLFLSIIFSTFIACFFTLAYSANNLGRMKK